MIIIFVSRGPGLCGNTVLNRMWQYGKRVPFLLENSISTRWPFCPNTDAKEFINIFLLTSLNDFLPLLRVEERIEGIVELSALGIVVGLGIEVAEHSDVVLDVV